MKMFQLRTVGVIGLLCLFTLTALQLVSGRTLFWVFDDLRIHAEPTVETVATLATTDRTRFNVGSEPMADTKKLLWVMPCANPTEIGGTVCEDSNQNGVQDNAEQAISGVTVTLYADNGLIGLPLVSDAAGAYLFTGLTVGNPYRIEFSGLPAGYEPSFVGNSNGTAIQFTVAGTCDNDFGILIPNDYTEDDPAVVTSCYVDGDQTNAGDVLISFPFSANPVPGEANDPAQASHEGLSDEIGTTFGLAYSRRANKLFAAAYMKRFSALAPSGSTTILNLG